MSKPLFKWPFRVLAAVFATLLTTQTILSQEATAKRIAKLAKGSTVVVQVDQGGGTGFVIAPGLVVTNHHVIASATQIAVHLVGMNETLRATILDQDSGADLAVLRVQGLDAPALALASEKLPQQGSRIYVYGNPLLRYEGSITAGEVSNLPTEGGYRWIQISAPISPGSSGSPVFDERGLVIGIASATANHPRQQNVNFAIPVFYLLDLVRNNGRIALQPSASPERSEPLENVYLYRISGSINGTGVNVETPKYDLLFHIPAKRARFHLVVHQFTNGQPCASITITDRNWNGLARNADATAPRTNDDSGKPRPYFSGGMMDGPQGQSLRLLLNPGLKCEDKP